MGKYTAGARPMTVWLTAYPLRLFFAFTWSIVMGWAPWPDATTGALPWWFYGVAMANFVLYRLACNVMFVSLMAFFSRIADPAIGGTYVLECLSGYLLLWKRADSLTGAH